MNERVETVLVAMPSGPVLVNLSDYLANPDAFGPLVDGGGVVVAPVIEGAGVIKATTPATEEPPPAAPVAPTYGVAKVGKKQVVIDLKTGQPVTLEGIDPEGYATAELAWSAIMALPGSLPPTTAA